MHEGLYNKCLCHTHKNTCTEKQKTKTKKPLSINFLRYSSTSSPIILQPKLLCLYLFSNNINSDWLIAIFLNCSGHVCACVYMTIIVINSNERNYVFKRKKNQ